MLNKGFFSASSFSSKKTLSSLPKCGACGLYKHCDSPKMKPSGDGHKSILIVGEAPGRAEDEEGIQFIGKSGRFLEDQLEHIGINMRKDCWITNSIVCRPPQNATPSPAQIEFCRPLLFATIKTLQPKVILLVGGTAVKSLIGHIWKKDPGAISKWAGWNIPDQTLNAWICPVYHPAYILRLHSKAADVINLRHLKTACSRKGRPWKKVPNYKEQVEVLVDTEEAADRIHKIIKQGGRAAFDYETNMLKPDNDQARIVSCSICHEGKTTISFPLVKKTTSALISFLRSTRVKKIAVNFKFEDRWSRAVLHTEVRKWEADPMLSAHFLDNRSGITGLKFQAYVKLGIPDYSTDTRPFFTGKEKGSNSENRIHEVDLPTLLLYGGLDSLLAYKVYQSQRRKLNEPEEKRLRF